MRWGNFLLGRVRKLLFCIMSQPKLWERKEYSFSHWCVLTSLCRDGTHAVTMSGCCRLLRRACIVQASSFSSAGFCLGFFFMQHNSHVKLICVSRGSCSMRRRLIVPSVCSSPVPVCIQGVSDLLIIPETHSHGVVWFVFDAQKMVCTVIFPIGVLKSPNLIFVWLVPECCWMDLLCKISISVNLWFFTSEINSTFLRQTLSTLKAVILPSS